MTHFDRSVKILLVDNHDLILDGLSRLLKSNNVSGEVLKAHGGEKAIEIVSQTRPDLIISDYRMPGMNGLELLVKLKERHLNIPILFVSMVYEPAVITNLLKTGASGFINKESTTDEMVYGVREILSGKKYLCRLTQSLLDKDKSSDERPFITKREIEVLKLIVDEKKNQQIANELHINVSTVETHKKNLIKKLNVKTSLGLVKYALEHQIFENR